MPNVHETIREHVSLSTRCMDRLYVNGYIPTLQIPKQLCLFMVRHLGQRIPSPVLLEPFHRRLVEGVAVYAERHGVAVVHSSVGNARTTSVNVAESRQRQCQTKSMLTAGRCGPAGFSQLATATGASLRKRSVSPSLGSTTIVSPSPKRPASTSTASGFSIMRWIVRLSGRAPKTGS